MENYGARWLLCDEVSGGENSSYLAKRTKSSGVNAVTGMLYVSNK